MTASKRVLTAARLDLKRNFLPHLCLALLLVLLTPVLFGLNDLDTQGSAVPLELMMPLTGILLLTPIFLPELTVPELFIPYYSSVCFLRS